MTAFARNHVQTAFGELTFELKSVNQRFLDINFRLPENLRYIEPEMRILINQHFQRGKIEIVLNFIPSVSTSSLKINHENLQQLVAAIDIISNTLQNAAAVDPLAILRWPGIAMASGIDTDEEKKIILQQFDIALNVLKNHREKEGLALASFILKRISAADLEIEKVKKFASEIVEMMRTKLREKLKLFTIEMDNNRLEQEIVLQCQKADIQEELDRLTLHLKETRTILKQGGVIGRKLDFLMQELNREANTVGSKAINIETTNAAVELKVLIEQMREQIQNIE